MNYGLTVIINIHLQYIANSKLYMVLVETVLLGRT